MNTTASALERLPIPTELAHEQPKNKTEAHDRLRETELMIAELEQAGVADEAAQAALGVQLEQDFSLKLNQLKAGLGEENISSDSATMIHDHMVTDIMNFKRQVWERYRQLLASKERLANQQEHSEKEHRAEALGSLDLDPDFWKIREQESLKYLTTRDSAYFFSRFSGEVNDDWYLYDKEGKPTVFLPSQNITAGWPEVYARARAEFARQFPKKSMKYDSEGNLLSVEAVAKIMHADEERRRQPLTMERIVGGKGAPETRPQPVAAGLERVQHNQEKQAEEQVLADYRSSRAQHREGGYAPSTDKEQLRDTDYVPAMAIEQAVGDEGEDLGLCIVDNELIIGSESVANKSWADEYDSRQGRIATVAEGFIKSADPSADAATVEAHFQHVFHSGDGADMERIKLRKINGPEGHVFIVKDGTHRVAGTKLAELPKILANVQETKPHNRIMIEKTDPRRAQWEKMIAAGLMAGRVQEEGEGTKVSLLIDQQVMPWCASKRPDFYLANRVYEKKYPGALSRRKNLKTGQLIPAEVFLDDAPDKNGKTALDYYLDGPSSWKAYAAQQQQPE